MITFSLAIQSLKARVQTVLLTLLAVALSVALFLSVEKVRTGAHDSFENTVSDMNIIIGARTGPLNLLLLSVFRIGNATAPVSWETYEIIKNRPDVAWAVPISLGDSHRGYRVLGTEPHYFEHYKYGAKQILPFARGDRFNEHALEAVIGSDVAQALGYQLGDRILIAHGIGDVSFDVHDDFKFEIVGILGATGTPVDRTVHISLEALERVHEPLPSKEPKSAAGVQQSDDAHHSDDHAHEHIEPDAVTAIFVGTSSPAAALGFRRAVNTYQGEALTAIIPGETLLSLWSLVGNAEKALLAISVFVVFVGLATILITILTSLNERRREMAILRAIGARPSHIFTLIVTEAAIIALVGAILGAAFVWIGLSIAKPWLVQNYGFSLVSAAPSFKDCVVIVVVSLAAGLMAIWPAARALNNALADGLSIRV